MIYVILGQTASGKTNLSLKIAREFSLPIISADAYQCYKMMQIGTDKPSLEEVEGINYHFFDEYDVDFNMSVYTFQKEGRKLIDKYIDEKKDIIVTGGTFLYIKALLFDYVFKDEKHDDNYDLLSREELQKLLKEKDYKTYTMIDNNNPRRLIRALRQIDNGIDREKLLLKNEGNTIYPCKFFNIYVDVKEGNELIDKRVDKMIEKGFIKEAEYLKGHYDTSLPAFKAIGYPEAFMYIDKKITLNECKQLIKIHTHQLAKKQRTFLKHQFSNILLDTRENIYNIISSNIKEEGN